MKTLVLETTAPFQGLPELVADQEGLFAKEGLTIEWVERESEDKSTHIDVTGPKGLDPFSSHGKMLEQGKADIYNACEWGNYCRVQDTKVKAARSAGAASSPTPRSWCGRIQRCSPRSSSPARRSACRSTSARIISRCICWKASCRATRSSCAAPRTARGRASTR